MPLCKQCSRVEACLYGDLERVTSSLVQDIKQLLHHQVNDDQGSGDRVVNTVSGKSIAVKYDKSREVSRYRHQAESRRELRIARHVLQLRSTCSLCSLISRHIERNAVAPDSEIGIWCTAFCHITDEQGGVQDVLRLSISEVRASLGSGALIGPVEAYEQDAVAEGHSRCILELQECCSPVPTTDDDLQQCMFGDVAASFSGRLTCPKVDLRLLRRWLDLCAVLHKDCCGLSLFPAHAKQEVKSFLVIDTERMCISDARAGHRYVALSYCWGKAPMLKHTVENSALLREEGSLSCLDIPATIKDAISLVRGIGERYLWVDALCIVQNDPVMQREQLAQMGLLYSQAAFTIVAASGDSADAALPGIRDGTREIEQDTIEIGGKLFLEIIGGREYYGGVQKSHWKTRAWTMQEQILSKRLLIFTDHQIYWSCWGATWFEEVVLEDVSLTKWYDPWRHERLHISRQVPMATLHLDPVDDPTTAYGLFKVQSGLDLYRTLVNHYRMRQLTFKSDILNAFSGFCQVIAATENESFKWGLPISNFDQALGWSLRGGGQRNYAVCSQGGDNGSSSTIPFPSWSWIAWHGSSGNSWIHWEDPYSTIKHPSVMFYIHDDQGELQPVSRSTDVGVRDEDEVGENSMSTRLGDFQLQWQTHNPIYVPPGTRLNTGLLYFWTDSATLLIRRWKYRNSFGSDKLNYSIVEFPMAYKVYINASAHLPFKLPEEYAGRLIDHGPWVGESADVDEYECEFLEMEFVVISLRAYDEKYATPTLAALAVHLEDGVMYRIGIAFLDHLTWAKLPNRVWKQVTLG